MYIKCYSCHKIMSPYEKHHESKDFNYFCPDCYESYCKEETKKKKMNRVKDFFSMFATLTIAVVLMTTFLLIIPLIGIKLGVPDWGGLIYLMFLVVILLSLCYAFRGKE